ncbi:heterokaryon incompatibility protein-domain-containing protein [Tricladium varicosporioides]|nr:heterokaryon incompatibility protein-domain-containing protein [Hymenoscyphus varicosporioides]
MSTQYQYDRLPSPSSIRLIELHPPSANKISFSIHATEINNTPPYDALSYTWGDPRCSYLEAEPDSSYYQANILAICNGRSIMIRRNLRDAMRMLQTASFAQLGRSKQRYIWIDALCIDQTNMTERSEQVMLMTLLYQKAESVIAWIGLEDATTQDALVVVDRLSSVSPTDMFNASADIYRVITAEDMLNPQSYHSKLGIDPITEQHWIAWVAFLHRPYFKRVWVVQEVTVAKSITVVCGSYILDWGSLSKAIWFIAHTKWFIRLHTKFISQFFEKGKAPIYSKMLSQPLDYGAGAMYLNQTRTGSEKAGKLYSLEALITNHRYCEATDPRDMIYALQGVANKNIRPFSTHGELMTPDYTVSVPTLYTTMARIMIRCYGDLRFLAHREGKKCGRRADLPSWVPDYSVKLFPDPLKMRGPNCNWCADGDLEWRLDDRRYDDPLLDTKGFLIGFVEAMSEEPAGDKDSDVLYTSYCNVALGLSTYYDLDPEPYLPVEEYVQSTQTRAEVLWRTLVADTFEGEHPAPQECGEQFLAHAAALNLRKLYEYKHTEGTLKERIKGKLHALMYHKFGWSINEKTITKWAKLFDSEPATSLYNTEMFLQKLSAIGDHFGNLNDDSSRDELSRPMSKFREERNLTLGIERHLFRTDGGLLGAGPLETQIGDEVWILLGSKTPVMLRDGSAGNKMLLGEAYVHGIMHGEVVDLGLDAVDVVLE